MLRAVGKSLGYYQPQDALSCYYINRVMCGWSDIVRLFAQVAFAPHLNKEELEAKERRFKLAEERLCLWLNVIEKQLLDLKGPYICGRRLTVADFCIAAVFTDIIRNREGNPEWAKRLKYIT